MLVSNVVCLKINKLIIKQILKHGKHFAYIYKVKKDAQIVFFILVIFLKIGPKIALNEVVILYK